MVPRKTLTPYYIGERVPLRVDGAETLLSGPTYVSPVSVYSRLASRFEEDDLVLSVAGDCVSCVAAMAGYAWRGVNPRLVWIDAHGDFNTEESTLSGHLGGMPLAKLCGRGDLSVMRDYGCPVMAGSRVTHLGGRDFDPGEQARMEDAGIQWEALPLGEPTHLHIDVDVLDPSVLPCVNYPAEGGWSLDQLVATVRKVAECCKVLGVTISTHDPRLDKDGTGATVLNRLVDAIAITLEENT